MIVPAPCIHHRYVPAGYSYFQVLPHTAWAAEYCKCGAVQHHLVNPARGPITEDQPTP